MLDMTMGLVLVGFFVSRLQFCLPEVQVQITHTYENYRHYGVLLSESYPGQTFYEKLLNYSIDMQ